MIDNNPHTREPRLLHSCFGIIVLIELNTITENGNPVLPRQMLADPVENRFTSHGTQFHLPTLGVRVDFVESR